MEGQPGCSQSLLEAVSSAIHCGGENESLLKKTSGVDMTPPSELAGRSPGLSGGWAEFKTWIQVLDLAFELWTWVWETDPAPSLQDLGSH